MAVIDFVNAGHVPTYHKAFVLALLHNGHRVFSLCSWQADVRAYVNKNNPELMTNLHTPWFPSLDGTIMEQFVSGFSRSMPLHERFWQKIRTSALLRWLRARKRWKISATIAKELFQNENQGNMLFLFSYIDEFLNRFISINWLNQVFPWDWTSLYLGIHNHRVLGQPFPDLFKEERVFLSKSCRSVGILDKGMREWFQTRLAGKAVVNFPDITDETPPRSDHALQQEIVKRASGRPIIGLLGRLHPRKSIDALLRVMQIPEAKAWFFVIAGDFVAANFPKTTIQRLTAIEQGRWENAYAFLGQIRDGEAFNSIFSMCDIIFAAYEDFFSSSNIITKCAVFNKPVIASSGSLMGESVRQWRLGITISERNPDVIIGAIVALLNGKNLEGGSLQPDFAGYAAAHSMDELRCAMEKLLT